MSFTIKNHTNTTIDGNLVNNGTIIVSGGTLDVTGAITGTGKIDIEHGGRIILGGSVSAGETVNLHFGVLEFTNYASRMQFYGSIGGLTKASVIQADGAAGGNGAGGLAGIGVIDITPTGALLDLAPRPNFNELPVHLLGHFVPDTYVQGVQVGDFRLANSDGNAIITLNPKLAHTV